MLDMSPDQSSTSFALLVCPPLPQHQANVGILDSSGKSLVMQWVDAVLAEFKKVVTWPVKSLKIDDLMMEYKAREARDACSLDYALDVTPEGTVQSVTVTSGATAPAGGSCSAPLILGGSGGTVNVPVSVGGTATVAVTGQTWNPLK